MITKLIGNTPMVTLANLALPGSAEIMAKLEMCNPGGSVKDRIALHMIEKAEQSGLLKPGGIIIEATSGNTGIGLGMVAASRGYHLKLVMPDTMSQERLAILETYGAELILTPGAEGMLGSVKAAEKILAANPDYYMPKQFENPANPEIHKLTTGPEILAQTGSRIDAFVAGVGTGGTVSGVGEVLKAAIPRVSIIGVEPAQSPVISGGTAGPHRIQGIGAGFIPAILNRAILDKVVKVEDMDAFLTARDLARKEGILAGLSAGAALFAALRAAAELGKGKRVVVLLPDTGERYLSMAPYFNFELSRHSGKKG